MRYQKTPLGTEIAISHLISFHYFEYVQNFFGKEERHNFWEFVYVDSGEVSVFADGEQILLHSGQGYLHCPMEYHNVMTKGIFSSVIIFSFSSASPGLRQLSGKRLTLFREEQRELVRLLEYGRELLEPPYDDFDQESVRWKEPNDPLGKQLFKNQMELFFLALIRYGRKPSTREKLQGTMQEAKDEENLVRTLEILSNHLYDSISLEDLAKEAACSVSYLEKLFRRKLNTGVKDYYHRLKIEQAKKWICQGGISFTEIAEKLGYGTIHNFSRVFKRYTKLSPTAYQKTAKNRGLR